MRSMITAVAVLIGALLLAGCGPTRTEIRTETTRTERILTSRPVDPGRDTAGQNAAGETRTEVTTETEERVLETRPLVR